MPRLRFTTATLAALLCVVSLLGAPLLSHAQGREPARVIELPVQSLARSLFDIGALYGVVLSFPPALVHELQAAPVAGRLTADEALDQALRGSGLMARRDASGALVLAAAPRAAVAPPAPAQLPAAAAPETRPAVLLDKVVMTSARMQNDDGLAASYAQSATRTLTAVVDLPQAVTVLTRDSLALQGEPTAAEALRYVAGAGSPTNSGGDTVLDAPFAMRGQLVQSTISGMRSLRGVGVFESAFVERIEVVKGPNGSVGGPADWGGRGATVNLELKRPGAGTGNVQRSAIDTRDGGTLSSITDLESTAEGPLGWRLVAHARRTGTTEAGYDPAHAEGLLGVLRWKADGTEALLTVMTDRRRDVLPAAMRVVAVPAGTGESPQPVLLAPSRSSALSPADGRDSQGTLVDADVRVRLGDDWRLRLLARGERLEADSVQHLLVEGADDAVLVQRGVYRGHTARGSAEVDLVGRVDAGPTAHELLFALDRDAFRSERPGRSELWRLCTCDGFEPDASTLGAPSSSTPTFFRQRGRQSALLVQDQVEWGPTVTRLALRRTDYSTSNTPTPHGDVPPQYGWDAGLAWKATPALTFYGGQQRTFEWSYAGSAGSRSIDDFLVHQQQAGLKWALDEQRALFTIEWFRIADAGVFRTGPTTEDVQSRSTRGVEIEYVGRVVRGIEISAGLEFNHHAAMGPTRHASGLDDELVLHSNIGSPRRAARLLADITVPPWLAESSRLGIGLVAQSRRLLSSAGESVLVDGPITLAGSARVNLSWTRDFGPHSLGFSIANVADRRIAGSYGSGAFIPLEPGRSFGLSLRSKF